MYTSIALEIVGLRSQLRLAVIVVAKVFVQAVIVHHESPNALVYWP